MKISEGDKIPQVKLSKATEGGPEPVDTRDFFAGRKVALFAVPGAFTPTCSAKHLPGFAEKAEELKAKGIDEIACISVNDAFVMGAWKKADGSEDITMLADGNGEFAEAIGLTMDGSGFGMGKRSQRYSMIVDDGEVRKLNVEQPGDFKEKPVFGLGVLVGELAAGRTGSAGQLDNLFFQGSIHFGRHNLSRRTYFNRTRSSR